MRIVCLSRYFFPMERGRTVARGHGVDIRLHELFKNLCAFGHEVHLVTPSMTPYRRWMGADSLGSSHTVFDGINIHRVRTLAPEFSLTRLPSLFRFARSLSLSTGKCDALMGEFHPFHTVGLECALLKKIRNLPLVMDIPDITVDEETTPLSRPFYKLNENLVFNTSDALSVVSEGVRKYAQGMVRDEDKRKRVEVIPNGVDVKFIKSAPCEDVKKKFGLDGKFVVGFVGSLTPQHGIEYLIRAAPSIIARAKNAKIFIVGGGRMEQELRRLCSSLGIQESVVFAGIVPRAEISEYLSAMDVCVAPFPRGFVFSINHPLKLSEYLAAGKPLVVCGENVSRIAREAGAGLGAEQESPLSIADAVVKLAEDGKMRRRMGASGRKYAVKKLEWRVLARKLEGVLRRTVQEAAE
ncbi:MAG: glycosyltransferase family 4 protein [Candidatus Micrarchaeota archaeon]